MGSANFGGTAWSDLEGTSGSDSAGTGWRGLGRPNGAGWGGSNGAGWGGPNDAGRNGVDGANWDVAEEVPALTQLVGFVVARSEADPSVVPTTLANVQRHDPGDAVGTKEFVFRFDGTDWTMNDLTIDPKRVDVKSELDQVYIWSLTNESPIPHPFHKHLSLFNILDINGAPPASFMSGWKDTVMVPPGSTVRILFKEETFTGTYVFHCHILEHEDHGMMLQEQVGL